VSRLIGVLRADAARVFGQLVGDLLGRPALAGQVPNDGGEGLATLAFRSPVPDQSVVVEKLLPLSSVKIERVVFGARGSAAVPCQKRVDQIVDGGQCNAVADLKSRHSDVACRVSVEFDAGVGFAIKK
jgi:hypothetical protein